MHRVLDQGVGEAALLASNIALAVASRERLQRRQDGSAALGIEGSAQRDQAVLALPDAQSPCFDSLDLSLDVAVGVGSVPCLLAEVAEAADAELARLFEERSFVETQRFKPGDRGAGARYEGEMREADLAFNGGHDAFREF